MRASGRRGPIDHGSAEMTGVEGEVGWGLRTLMTRERVVTIGVSAVASLLYYAFRRPTLSPLVLVPIVVGVVFVTYHFLGQFILKRAWRRAPVFLTEAVPAHWPELVHRATPLSAYLTDDQRQRLLKMVQLFLHEKRFEGAGGFSVTEEVRVTIAAQACLLLVALPVGCYPNLKTVIVYGGAYRPHEPHQEIGAGRVARRRSWRAGESWVSGVVVVAWDSVRHGASNIRDGHNVVLHEFAHQLDQEDGVADGVPGRLPPSSLRTWGKVLGRHYTKLRKADRKGRRTVLRKYGATNEAEFFAVGTEAFFEKGRTLQRKSPDLYAALRDFYGLDPASWS